MCLDILIIDDEFVEGTENFIICGLYEQPLAVMFDDNGCTNIFIKDNDG